MELKQIEQILLFVSPYCLSWESVPKVEKVCPKMRKFEKVCQKLKKCAKSWESMRYCMGETQRLYFGLSTSGSKGEWDNTFNLVFKSRFSSLLTCDSRSKNARYLNWVCNYFAITMTSITKNVSFTLINPHNKYWIERQFYFLMTILYFTSDWTTRQQKFWYSIVSHSNVNSNELVEHFSTSVRRISCLNPSQFFEVSRIVHHLFNVPTFHSFLNFFNFLDDSSTVLRILVKFKKIAHFCRLVFGG